MQSYSGLVWLNGDADQPPVPFALAVADMMAGAQLTQGLLACLIKRGISRQGAYVQVSLLEAILDMQFEVLTTYMNDGGELPQRSAVNNGHAYVGAPYGIYETKDGYLALAMGSVTELGKLLYCAELEVYVDPQSWSEQRDVIKQIWVDHLKTQSTKSWLDELEPADYWCAEVLTWQQLLQHDGFKGLNMIQEIIRNNGTKLLTTRCPIRIDGHMLVSAVGSPEIGQDNEAIGKEFIRD